MEVKVKVQVRGGVGTCCLVEGEGDLVACSWLAPILR